MIEREAKTAKTATKPLLLGMITTKVLVTECDSLYASTEGMTIGQAVDEYIDRIRGVGQDSIPKDFKAPEIFSVTIELPRED